MKRIGNLVICNLKASEFMRQSGWRSAKLQITKHKTQIPQRGYMLITLMLALALIAIALLTVLPEIGQQIQRDREEEMQHRGTAYMRAIQHFYKKFGRYPTRVEELENTNNLRFLRKRYKDPLNRDRATGKEKEFKLLHQTDISLNNGPVLSQTPGQNVLGDKATATQTVVNGDSGKPADAEGDSNPAESSPTNSVTSSSSPSGFNGPTFGGGPILGVASTSKAKTIRVFYDKSHYNDWLFIYVPQADRGGLLTGPVNPGMPGGNLGVPTPGQPVGGPTGPGLTPSGGQPQVPATPPQNTGPGASEN